MGLRLGPPIKQLPAAIEQDHKLHDEGAKPNNGFDRP